MSKSFDYKEAAKRLRSFGLGGDFDLRYGLSPQQKSAITRKYKQFQTIVNHPEQFQILTVKNKTAKKINIAAKKIPIKNGKTKLIIPVDVGEKVSIRKGRAVYKYKGFTSEVLSSGSDFFADAEKAFKRKLKKNEYIQVQIGSAKPFKKTFTDLKTLLFYTNNFTPKDDPKDYLIQQLIFTRVEMPVPKKKPRK